ncbi:citryl-CoA lyase [Microbaculum marinum]|uniref:citrate synthase (unknown stereospecificity) n=1 Tax=Microbaculum marinum TaxID=1764581 RepID=A0AAW9RMC9_9HYPH
MKVGKQDAALSAICTSDTHTINVRGKELSADLIGNVDFTSYFFFLVTGEMPDDRQKAMLDAVLVAIAEHGLVPSNQAARMTLAAAPDALQGAVAAGLLGCGSVVLGSTEACGRFLAEVLESAKASGEPVEEAARTALQDLRDRRLPVPGFGHPQHKDGDPRAIRLLALARERGVAGAYVGLVETMSRLVAGIWGRSLPLNVSGAIPAVMLDAGFPVTVLKGIPILARTASLIAHLNEEMSRSIGFILAGNAAETIGYDGPALAGAGER